MPFGQLQPTYYRVFQHRRQPGLCCAVRATMLVPYFVRASEWDFGMNLREDGILPLGFQPAPAREAASAFGYYLFHNPSEDLSPRYARHGLAAES